MPLLTDYLAFGNIHFQNKTYLPEMIQSNIDEVFRCITQKSISNSPFVFLFAPNHIKTVYAVFGIIKAGKICVLVDPGQGKLEVEDMVKTTPPGAIIHVNKASDSFNYNEEFEFKHYMLSEAKLQGLDDVCLVLYTAASDGFAKAAMLTYKNMLADGFALVHNGLLMESVSCSLIGYHHLFAFQTGILAPALIQSNILIIDSKDFTSLRETGTQFVENKIDHLYTVPMVFNFLKKIPGIEQCFKNAKNIVSGGCKLNSHLFNIYKDLFGVEIHEGYGLTEASPICAWHRPLDSIKIDSVGRAFSCCEIMILNTDGQKLEQGKTGEICIKGENVFKGYYNNIPSTEDSLKNGILHTGDLGKLDDDGYLYLTGLKKEMLNLSGNKVYPAEVARLIKKHCNVLTCEIKGRETESNQPSVIATVRLRNSTETSQKDLKHWCRENITGYKVPREWVFI